MTSLWHLWNINKVSQNGNWFNFTSHLQRIMTFFIFYTWKIARWNSRFSSNLLYDLQVKFSMWNKVFFSAVLGGQPGFFQHLLGGQKCSPAFDGVPICGFWFFLTYSGEIEDFKLAFPGKIEFSRMHFPDWRIELFPEVISQDRCEKIENFKMAF